MPKERYAEGVGAAPRTGAAGRVSASGDASVRPVRSRVEEEDDRYIVNLGTIPLYLWASRVGSLERPDWLILDLDPKGAPFTDVVKVARALRRLLDALELPSYVKTSGATGLHILLPLGARYTYA